MAYCNPSMDDLLSELYDTSKPYERVYLPGGQTEGKVLSSRNSNLETHAQRKERPRPGTDQSYADEFRKTEEEAFQATAREAKTRCYGDAESMNEMEALSTLGTAAPIMDEFSANQLMGVYNEFDFNHEPAINLPIASYRSLIVDTVQANPIVVIEGHTGCGKTTQVPQYILDHHRENRLPCNIIVTQPRRIAAISVSKRVALERNWRLGTVVGYKIGLKSEMSQDTRLLYCTTGVLLQTLVSEKNMNQYTHIIIDEAHERDQDMDFLLLLARKLQRSNSRQVKVVIMSATFNCDKFAEYFCISVLGTITGAPIVTIDKRMAFKVSEYYTEDIKQLAINLMNDPKVAKVTKNHHLLATQLIKVFDAIEIQEHEARKGNKHYASELQRGSVLVFLPGIYEIEELYSQLNANKVEKKWNILPLHSSITSSEQAAVFNAPQQGYRKIILSTNIAESSITVPDIMYVIDYCMTKQLVKDDISNFTTLELTWASKSNCIQRSGRVGRVATGRVYRLVSREHFRMLDEHQQPEMLRCPLSRLVLMAKVLDSCPPKELLALAIDPPDLDNIQTTVLMLKEIGGLLKTVNGIYSNEDGDITFIGRVMARLPVDVHVAKLIVLGHLFCVLDSTIIIAAAMSVKNMFATRFRDQMNSYLSKVVWSDSSNSDQIAFLNAYKVWRTRKDQGYFERTKYSSEKDWADKYCINLRSLYELNDLISELRGRLHQLGIEEVRGLDRVAWPKTEEPLVLKLVLAGALYPHYFVRGSLGGQINEKDAVRTLVGRDPYTSVYLTNFDEKQPGDLYVDAIKTLLKPCTSNMKISFEHSSKVYVEFPRDDESDASLTHELPYKLRMPGRISLTVYKAVKMRQLGISLPLRVLPEFKALKYYSQKQHPSFLAVPQQARKEIEVLRNQKTTRESPAKISRVTSRFPPLDVSHLHLIISHVADPGKFWVQDASNSTQEELAYILHMLNRQENSNLKPLSSRPSVGQLVVAPFEGRDLYRAKVLSVQEYRQGISVVVRYIDYGNTVTIHDVSQLLDFGPPLLYEGVHTILPVAIECVLTGIEPSVLTCCNGQWSKEANNFFSELVKDRSIYAQVYSVVNSVMSLRLYNDTSYMITVNDILVQQNYAQPTEEPYLSKANHEARENVDAITVEMKIVCESQQQYQPDVGPNKNVSYLEPRETTHLVYLKGPFSPLEMKIYPMLRSTGINKEVTIEQLSVNSVLMDDNPQDPHERLVVAGCVQTTSRGTFILRQTTILPNIPGMPALVSLIFSPSCELRVNESYSRLTGVLCGLGCEPNTGTSYFGEHDIEVTFDTKFDMADIETVNCLRLWMNRALHTNVGEVHPHHTLAGVREYQEKIKHFLTVLLKKKRDWQTPEPPSDDHTWKCLEPQSLLYPGEYKCNGREIYQIIWGVALEAEDARKKRAFGKNLMTLLNLSESGTPIFYEKCQMCNIVVHSLPELRLHLQCSIHLEREALLRIDLNNEHQGHKPVYSLGM